VTVDAIGVVTKPGLIRGRSSERWTWTPLSRSASTTIHHERSFIVVS
jgi:hypothetical protein